MENELQQGFRQMFCTESRRPIVALQYDEDVVPMLEDIKKVRYFSVEGTTIAAALNAAINIPGEAERMLIDISCSAAYSPAVDEFQAITTMLAEKFTRDVDVVWALCTDSKQIENVVIRFLLKVK